MGILAGQFHGEYKGSLTAWGKSKDLYQIYIVRGALSEMVEYSNVEDIPDIDGFVLQQDKIKPVYCTTEKVDRGEQVQSIWKEKTLYHVKLYNYKVEPIQLSSEDVSHRGFISGYMIAQSEVKTIQENEIKPETQDETVKNQPPKSTLLTNVLDKIKTPSLPFKQTLLLSALSFAEVSPQSLSLFKFQFFEMSIIDMLDEDIDYDYDDDGIPNAVDQCPHTPEDHDGFADSDGCPDRDNDQDGVPDQIDKCPLIEGYGRAGCPKDEQRVNDDDGDGIPNDIDLCPDEPETLNQFNDFDGCPDVIPEQLKELIGRQDAIRFEKNSSTLKDSSTKQLEELRKILEEHRTLHILIEGHTDNTGPNEYNRTLSKERAESVTEWFAQEGIGKSRLHSEGFGPYRPAQPNSTREGRRANRRVEFVCFRCDIAEDSNAQ